MRTGFHPPVEEYLEAIYGLSEEGVEVIQARLVERLGISAQAVSEMVQRLTVDGYLDRTNRSVALTDKGEEQARSIVRRHRLAERFLVDILGLPWERAHIEAGQWEHVISDDVEERFMAILNNPTTCPHGNPIPGAGVDLARQIAMADLEAGAKVVVARVTERIEVDNEALTFCSRHGLTPGRRATVLERAPDGTLTIELDGDNGTSETLALGTAMTRHIFVAPA